jgi:hypothetical protein
VADTVAQKSCSPALGYQDGQRNNTSGYAEDAAWAMTLVNTTATSQSDPRTEAAFWYSSNGANCKTIHADEPRGCKKLQ